MSLFRWIQSSGLNFQSKYVNMTSPKYSFFRCKTYYLVKCSDRIVQKHVYVPSLSVLAKGINSREIWISRPWENGQKRAFLGHVVQRFNAPMWEWVQQEKKLGKSKKTLFMTLSILYFLFKLNTVITQRSYERRFESTV